MMMKIIKMINHGGNEREIIIKIMKIIIMITTIVMLILVVIMKMIVKMTRFNDNDQTRYEQQ